MKLLIVDDDVYTREGLAENIPWELYGIEEVMQAENGKEALHTVSWYLPDLIITDIRMPQKNGIDFCKEAVRLVPDCKIIFITGYMQTKYLKDAINLSAVAFIEKPIQPEAVLEALEKAVGKIRRQQETVQLQKENISYQKTKFLHLLQQKNTSEEQLEEICRDCGFVCARDENYLCMEIRFENEIAQLEPCRTLLEQYLGDSTDFLLLDQMPEAETAIAVLACQAKRQQEIRRKLHLFVAKYPEHTVAVGYFVERLSEVYNSSRMAQLAMEQGFFQPEVHYLELQRLVKREFIDPEIYQVFLQIYRENPWRVRDWYREQMEQFCAQKDTMPEGAQLISLTKTFASQILKDYPESLKNTGLETMEQYMECLSGSRHIRNLEDRFYQLLQGMEQCLESQKGYSRVVSDIRTYCSQHLADSALGGQMITDHFGLSVTYLNQLFKQELGMTIKQYISEMRMERAEQLLTQTYETVDEIAAKCGYSNGNYFAKAFRENRKMSPTDYRKMMEKRYETKGTT